MATQYRLGKIWRAFNGYEKVNQVAAWRKLFNYSPMVFRFSTSIQNFADRVTGKVEEWSWGSLFKPTVFIGLYHLGDWVRFLIHRGPKMAFWCGGDILRLEGSVWKHIIKRVQAKHICENEVEHNRLELMGIKSKIHPILFFDDIENYKVTFKLSNNPHVWITGHPGRGKEYGVDVIEEIADQLPDVTFQVFGQSKTLHEIWQEIVFEGVPTGIVHNVRQATQPNIKYHGWVSTEEMEKVAKKCQAGIRLNDFDGCPHVVTKGILWGQYPISKIPYPYVDSYKTNEQLVGLLKKLKHKKKANLVGRNHWYKVLNEFPWKQ